MAQPNWKKIAKEYITTEIAMRPLAEKHKVPFSTLRVHAKREEWSEKRRQYQLRVGQEAVQNVGSKAGTLYGMDSTKPDKRAVSEAELIFEGAALAIQWIVNRLNSGEVEDYREVESLIRSMNGAKGITRIKQALDNREQEARIANLEQQTAKAAREPVEITFAGTEDAAR